MLIFYNLFLLLYHTSIRLVAPWNPKARLWLKGRYNVFEALEAEFAQNSNPVVWMHCASLGEFEQGRPVLEKIKGQYPHYKLLLTFYSPSGYEVRKNYAGADVICYLPADGITNASRFLSIVKPSLVVWVKYEYWYYYLEAIHRQNIPLLLISGIFRNNQVFFSWYGSLHRKMLSYFTQLFVQNETSATLLRGIRYSATVTIAGDTRFDRVIEIAEQYKPLPVIEQFCSGYQVIVAGSTWPEDEEELAHFANMHTDLRFIIAPHEIDDMHLRDAERLFKHTIRLSQWQQVLANGNLSQPATGTPPTKPNVLIIDNIGMLSKLYRYATITYVGGGFGNGIHNILEAAVYGKPVLFGTEYDKFMEAVELIVAGGAFSVESALELETLMDKLLHDTNLREDASGAAKNYVYNKRGATQKILDYIVANRLLTN